jgi:hypothetical protein
MGDRYRLATDLGKPLVVCEMGASIHDPAAKLRWITEARAAVARYPRLVGVVWFDARNPHVPSQPLVPASQVPDWRLTPGEAAVFFAPPREPA